MQLSRKVRDISFDLVILRGNMYTRQLILMTAEREQETSVNCWKAR